LPKAPHRCALPGERVDVQIWERKPRFDLASAVRVVQPSSMRVAPACPHYERCGGCSLQHLDTRAQVAIKQRVLEDNLARIGRVQPSHPARIHGQAGTTASARMSVRMSARRYCGLMSAHPLRGEMDSQSAAPAHSALIAPLRAALSETSLSARIPRVESHSAKASTCCAARPDPLTPTISSVAAFARPSGGPVPQPGGPATLQP
jgi:23S rRNA (uracil1939-C5)-methyltransferase